MNIASRRMYFILRARCKLLPYLALYFFGVGSSCSIAFTFSLVFPCMDFSLNRDHKQDKVEVGKNLFVPATAVNASSQLLLILEIQHTIFPIQS